MFTYLKDIKELLVLKKDREKMRVFANSLLSLVLSRRQLCDLELLLTGAFSPLSGFLSEKDYKSVLREMRLTTGSLWPVPICLDITNEFSKGIKIGDDIALRDSEGVALAILTISDLWKPDKVKEALEVYKTDDEQHPGVNYLFNVTKEVYLGGAIRGIESVVHYDFERFRHSPKNLRNHFKKLKWTNIVAFQTRNPLHRAHFEMTRQAALKTNSNLLIHPVVGMTKPGDVDHFTRVRCYEAIMSKYPKGSTTLSLLNLAMRMAGPREAVWHGLIRKNYGCTHLIVGRDHAGPGKNKHGTGFYSPYAAQALFKKFEAEIGVEMVDFKQMVWVDANAQYRAIDTITPSENYSDISGTELRHRLVQGLEVPDWFSFPEVLLELKRFRPERTKQGFTVFFTGFSGSGKSTIANALMIKLLEIGDRPVTLLDGDVVRKRLSSELGFTKSDRDLNVSRIGYVASQITKNGGIAICAPIAPYANSRKTVREEIEEFGSFIEVYVNTSLEECERRDRKGLYKLARSGKLKEFTGISDPYEEPELPEVILLTEKFCVENCASQIILKLKSMGLIAIGT